MVVVLKTESESSAKRRSLILAIMLCGSIVVAGWAAYLVGEVTSDRAGHQPEHKPVAQIDLRSPSVYHLSDNNGTSPVLQVERRGLENKAVDQASAGESPAAADRNSTATDRHDASLALPRAEFSGLPHASSPVPLGPGFSSARPQPGARDWTGENVDRTQAMAENMKQRMKLGKVEMRIATEKELDLPLAVVVMSASYEQSLPQPEVEAREETDFLRILTGPLPGFEIPRFAFPAPVIRESSASSSLSSPRLPWRLPGIDGE